MKKLISCLQARAYVEPIKSVEPDGSVNTSVADNDANDSDHLEVDIGTLFSPNKIRKILMDAGIKTIFQYADLSRFYKKPTVTDSYVKSLKLDIIVENVNDETFVKFYLDEDDTGFIDKNIKKLDMYIRGQMSDGFGENGFDIKRYGKNYTIFVG